MYRANLHLSKEISKTKEQVLKRVEERKRMLSTFIICMSTAIVSILILILIKMRIWIFDLQSNLGRISFLLPGLIRVILLILIFTTLIIGLANIREYYVIGISGFIDIIFILASTLLFAYFMFDFPTGIADTLCTLGGCMLVVVYFYLIQD